MPINKSFCKGICLAAVVMFIYSIDVRAQPNPTKWAAKANQPIDKLNVGDKFTVQVTGAIEEGWYIYSLTQPAGGPIATSIGLASNQPFKLAGKIKGPKPETEFVSSFGINVETYKGTAVFTFPLQVLKGAEAGSPKPQLQVRFQACNGDTCLMPRTVTLDLYN